MLHENQDFKVEAEEQAGCRLVAHVEVKKERVQKDYKEAVKRINKEVSLPGFRKGKAPDAVILKQYPNQIEREWKDIVVNSAFQATLELSKIYPYSKNAIEKPQIDECSLEHGARVQISYEYYPKLPEVQFDKLALPAKEKIIIPEKEVDNIVAQLQKSHARFDPIEGQPAQEGDYVDLSIEKSDEEPPRPLITERRFELSSQMPGWLQTLVVGMNVGEQKEGMSPAHSDGSEFKVRVTLHKISKSEPHPFDDELAKKVGASSKEDLVAKIRSNLEKEAEAKQKEQRIAQMEDLLVARYPFDLPRSLVKSEIAARMKEKAGSQEQQVEEEAERALRLHFLMNSVGERAQVKLSQEELNQKLQAEMMSNPYYYQVAKEGGEALSNAIRQLSDHFLREKVREYALSLCDK